MIEVEHLTKRYGSHTAVDDISFTVEDGGIYGLLGPNGAGKSTTMNIITGYISATDGTVKIDGHDIADEPAAAKACIGYLRNQFALLRPKILVCLGRIAGQKLIKPDLKITKEHGIFFDKGGTLMMATLHPAALLRNPAQKPAAFEDYLKLRQKIDELECDIAKQ